MSRRARRMKSDKQSSRGRKRGGSWLYRALAILVLMAILTGFGGYFWLKSYLHSDNFRIFLGQTVGESIGAEAHFELFEWQGMQAKTKGFSAENGELIQSMRADDVQAKVDLSGIKRGVWEISDLRVKQLDIVMNVRENLDISRDEGSISSNSSSADGFLVGLLPKRAELSSADIDWLNLYLQTEAGNFEALNVIVRIDGSGSEGAYDVNLTDGLIKTSWFGSPLNLISARGKYQNGRIFITDSKSEVYESGVLHLNGEVGRGEFGLYGNLRDVQVGELVPEDWKQRLTSLPILDTIAAYANTSRFRRLDFSEAKLKYHKQGNRIELSEIMLASEGLVRIEGRLILEEGGKLDGHFRVGITPGTLTHIPGAETKVFIRGEKGLLWAPLRITGQLDNPKEDLTDRMIAAAGERMFELVPETGKMALKFAHDSAVQLPGKAVETGNEALEAGAGALKKGLEGDVVGGVEEGVRGIFNLIPERSDNSSDKGPENKE